MSGTNGHNTEAVLELSRSEVDMSNPIDLSLIAANKFAQASMLKLTSEESAILQEPVKDEEVNVRPDGLIYLPQVFVRDRLNKAIGIGQWVLVEEFAKQLDGTMMFKGSLYIRGCYVATAIGEMEYHQNNAKQSWASVYEGAKSDCLTRCSKDLGIGKECWMPTYSAAWVQNNACKVWRSNAKQGKGEFQWRHKNSTPFWDETGVAPDSPNKPAYTKETPPKNEPKKDVNTKHEDKKPNVGTTFQKISDAQLKKELAETKLLNNLRILFDRVSKTNAKQAEKFKPEFTKKRKEIEEKLLKQKEGNNSDVIISVIDSLTDVMFNRGDWESLEKLIDEVKDSKKKLEYINRYKEHLVKIGKGDHEIGIVPF